MERTDVLIVGGGPAGSACAHALTKAGRDVVLLDAAVFPRDKPCAGWITPEVLAEIPFEIGSYAAHHVAQPISGFRVGRIDGAARDVDYRRTVSYGIRRREFDAALLRSSGARAVEGERVRKIQRRDGMWVVNESYRAPVLVGAGGHFCPVARQFGGAAAEESVVVAREVEFALEDPASCAVGEERPELYFCRDLRGYGWCFRKGRWLNVGLGRLDTRGLAGHLEGFLAFLLQKGRVGALPQDGWRGHAYRVRRGASRHPVGEGFVLIGDAAGLAAPASGEGILPALVSGRLAAEAIVASRLETYAENLTKALGPPGAAPRIPDSVTAALGAVVLALPEFASRVVLDRWFLHRL